jgi:GNAT superfamily N-acetyltransferase
MSMIFPIGFVKIEPYVVAGRREGLAFSNSTQYYGWFENGELVGFTGIVPYRDYIKAKNHYVLPEYRRRGLFKQMLDWTIREAQKLGCRYIEATCTEKSLPEYLKRGAGIIQHYKTCTKVRLPI